MTSSDAKDKNAEVFTARDRLSGALNLAVDKFGGEEHGAHGFFGSPVKRLQSLDSPLGSPTKSPRPRRRRKKEGPADSAFHHTFVMKLFDRSVDLAQFQEGTSLYPVCRAWMRNQPHNTSMAPRVRTPTPEPEDVVLSVKEETDNAETILKEEDLTNSQDQNKELGNINVDAKSSADDGCEPLKLEKESSVIATEGKDGTPKTSKQDKSIYKMPVFKQLPKGLEGGDKSLRIPEPINTTVDLDFFDKEKKKGTDGSPTHESLLNEHMARWYKVRRRWKVSAAKNEERYQASMSLLKDMFER